MTWHLGFPCQTSTLKIQMIVELFLNFLMKCITHNITTAALWMTCTLWHNLDFTWKSNKFLLARFRFQFSATDWSWSWWNKDVGSFIFVSAYFCTPENETCLCLLWNPKKLSRFCVCHSTNISITRRLVLFFLFLFLTAPSARKNSAVCRQLSCSHSNT